MTVLVRGGGPVPGPDVTEEACQPTATSASSGGMSAHASGSSPATGPSSQADAERHSGGSASTGNGEAASWATWRRPPGSSMLSNTGPLASTATRVHPGLAERCRAPRRQRPRHPFRRAPRRAARAGRLRGPIRHGPTEPPAARVVGDPVARCRADHDHARRAGTARGSCGDAPILAECSSTNFTKVTTRSTRTSSCTAIQSGSPTSSSTSSRRSAAGSRTVTRRTR